MANISKSELLDRVSEAADTTRTRAEEILGAFFDTVTSAAKSGDKVSWPGFGSFSTSSRAARTGRNPRTGAPVKIAASVAMKFTSASALKEALNTKAPAKKAAGKKAPAKKAPAKKAAAKKR